MKKKLVYIGGHVLNGVGIGAIIATACMLLWNDDPVVRATLLNVAAWLAASALYGLVSLIYDADWLPMPALSIVHMACCLGITLFTAWRLGYIAALGGRVWVIVLMFAAIYAAVGLLVLWAEHKNAKELNQKLK